jgi:hypothetical protein
MYTLLIAVLNGEEIYKCFARVIFPVVGSFFICFYIFHDELENVFERIGNYFAVLVWLNVILMLLFPNGVIYSSESAVVARANWLWGSKNNIVDYVHVIMAFLLLGMETKKYKWKRVITIIAFYLSVVSMHSEGVKIFKGSATATIMVTLILILYVLRNKAIVRNVIYYMSVGRMAFISFILTGFVFYVGLNSERYAILNKILGVLDKNTTFGRNSVWRIVLQNIYASFPWGIGEKSVWLSFTQFTYSFWGNQLMRYGLFGVLILMCLFYLCDNKENIVNDRVFIIRICILALLLGGLMDEISYRAMFILLIISNYISETVNSETNNELSLNRKLHCRQ